MRREDGIGNDEVGQLGAAVLADNGNHRSGSVGTGLVGTDAFCRRRDLGSGHEPGRDQRAENEEEAREPGHFCAPTRDRWECRVS